jgi:tol-pal system protein YbgF
MSPMSTRFRFVSGLLPLALVLAALWPLSAHALFNDDEARKAIIELRQRVEANRQAAEAANAAHVRSIEEARESNATLRRSLLDLANQIEQVRAEMARLRGQNEQLARDVSELQRQQKDVQLGLDERLRKVEPVRVTVDGKEFMAEPAEQRDFEAAMQMLRRSEFVPSAQAYTAFLRRYPESGYTAAALYWLGNAQYANRAYKEAIETHRRLVAQFPAHARAPEVMLALANSQIELKDSKAARRTLEDLIKAHPQSEAAVAARERLSQLR